MTIKDWNNLPQSKKERIADSIVAFTGWGSNAKEHISKNFTKSSLTMHQEFALERAKLLKDGSVELNFKVVV